MGRGIEGNAKQWNGMELNRGGARKGKVEGEGKGKKSKVEGEGGSKKGRYRATGDHRRPPEATEDRRPRCYVDETLLSASKVEL